MAWARRQWRGWHRDRKHRAHAVGTGVRFLSFSNRYSECVCHSLLDSYLELSVPLQALKLSSTMAIQCKKPPPKNEHLCESRLHYGLCVPPCKCISAGDTHSLCVFCLRAEHAKSALEGACGAFFSLCMRALGGFLKLSVLPMSVPRGFDLSLPLGAVEAVDVIHEGAHLVASGLSTEVVETILQHRAPSTRKLYALKWKLSLLGAKTASSTKSTAQLEQFWSSCRPVSPQGWPTSP